jgi:hypothetical protein
MLPKPFIALFLVFTLVTMACGISVNLPDTQVKTGPTVTEEVSIPAPDDQPIELSLEFGAGKLNLNPGSSSALVEGILNTMLPISNRPPQLKAAM